jgi:hypothetical protein
VSERGKVERESNNKDKGTRRRRRRRRRKSSVNKREERKRKSKKQQERRKFLCMFVHVYCKARIVNKETGENMYRCTYGHTREPERKSQKT